ncbi:MAG: MmgE/PrpD family protein [Betaproteobacteria bacterium]|nr:MmgE/PrpD family protein [Betaproteobacteria bacterium]
MNRTATLCAALAGLTYERIPQRVTERAKDLVLDHLGVALYASPLPWSQMVREHVLAQGDRAESTVYGYGAALPRNAALANATAAHGIELDDTHDESMSHPGAVVIPVALALAEARKLDGRELLAAIVAGYEAQCRAGSAATEALMAQGFHPTAAVGAFGATAAAARLLKLNADQLESAFGLVASMASGTMQFTQDPDGTMVKRLHAGIPAQNGILAAELASRGYRGPRAAIDGRYGLARVFAREERNLDRLTRELGEAWEIDQVSIKLYACCRLFHSFIDAMRECRANASWQAADVETVQVLGPKVMYTKDEGRMQNRPRSVMSAQYSIPYVAAATLMLDPCDPRSFNEETMVRADVLAMIDRVSPEHTPELDRYFPARCPGGVRIRLKSGETVERTFIDSIGTPLRPLDRDGIKDKYRTLVAGLIEPVRRERIADAVFAIDRNDGVAQLMRLLRDSLKTNKEE